MEFYKKLQELRKQKGLTQEELANAIYVTRTAVSKWESNRGYPSIESLKAIAHYFNISIDELLSNDELLTVAEEDGKEKQKTFFDLVFGLLDISVALFFFMPLFGQNIGEKIYEVSLFNLTNISHYLIILYDIVIIFTVLFGVITLALQSFHNSFWSKHKQLISLLLNILGMLLFIISSQPYAALLMFAFLAIKALILIKTKRH